MCQARTASLRARARHAGVPGDDAFDLPAAHVPDLQGVGVLGGQDVDVEHLVRPLLVRQDGVQFCFHLDTDTLWGCALPLFPVS
jgi:hypothetical protein